jgi:4-amino-4-deoxy-L-arabinose transferase-like glycosyltransferase
MDLLQNFIHKLEVGGGTRYFRIALGVLAVFLLAAGYNWRAFRNMSTQEAMDSAQLARNIAQGKGYTTLFVRPFSMFLLRQHNQEKLGVPAPGTIPDFSEIKERHPDIANPPVYPVVLAGLMKVLPFEYTLPSKPQGFWSHNNGFWRHQPDFFISMFNQFLFFVVLVLLFFLARRLFDRPVAWLATLLTLGSELLWRFNVSGLSTVLLLLIFMGLAWCAVLLEAETREPRWGQAGIFVLAGLAGVLVALGGLTRYGFGWLILPLVLFIVVVTGRQRIVLALTAFIAFAAVFSPWIVRNYSVSGTPFGTAGYALVENTYLFSEHRLERSLEPDLHRLAPSAFWQKLFINTRQIAQNDLPKLGGNWVVAFFLVGLLISFHNPATQRLRYFLIASLAILVVIQALGRTQLSDDSPEINSENLLVLLVPLVMAYGVSLFFLLLDQIELPFRELRYVILAAFVGLTCLPMIFVFLPPRTIPVAYPPYNPPAIQVAAGWTKENELTMSDLPWAMAWYGQRQCVWLTLNLQPDFYAINDYQKGVQELYLTRATLDSRFLSSWLSSGEQSWGTFMLGCLVRRSQNQPGPPAGFPLHYWQLGWPENFLLTAREHWPRPTAEETTR